MGPFSSKGSHCEESRFGGTTWQSYEIALLRLEHNAVPRTVLVQGGAGLRSQ